MRCSQHSFGLPEVLHQLLENLAVASRLGHYPDPFLCDELREALNQKDLEEMASAAVPLVEKTYWLRRSAERLHMDALLAGRVSTPSTLERDLLATLRFAKRVEKRAERIRRQEP
jgi:hypothetical protein